MWVKLWLWKSKKITPLPHTYTPLLGVQCYSIDANRDLDTGVKFFSTKQKEQQQQQNLNSDNLTWILTFWWGWWWVSEFNTFPAAPQSWHFHLNPDILTMSIFLGFLTSRLVEMAWPRKFYSFVIHIRNTFCKKKWPRSVYFSPQSLIYLQQPRTGGRHHQLDDHRRNPNINTKII